MSAPSVRFHLPAPVLRPFITSYYFTDVPPDAGPVQDLLTPEWPNLRFTLAGDWWARLGDGVLRTDAMSLFGPTSRAVEVGCNGGGFSVGVGLLPLGWAHLVGAPADLYADRAVPPGELLGAAVEMLFEDLKAARDDPALVRLLDAFFVALHESRPDPTPLLVQAHEVLLNPAVNSVEAFAQGLGMSSRHAGRLSHEMFGFPPKLLLQRQRFLRTLAVLSQNRGAVWAELIDDSYYDQPHFVRDFKRFMGCTPTVYFGSPRPLIGAAAKARAAMLGDGYQGLHPPIRA